MSDEVDGERIAIRFEDPECLRCVVDLVVCSIELLLAEDVSSCNICVPDMATELVEGVEIIESVDSPGSLLLASTPMDANPEELPLATRGEVEVTESIPEEIEPEETNPEEPVSSKDVMVVYSGDVDAVKAKSD